MLQKSTLNITLAFIGAVVLTSGCSSDSEEKRDVYKSKEDCIAEWGDAKKCEEVKQGSTHYSSGGRYYSPSYTHSHTSSRALSSFTTHRGGFGASASFHHSGS